MAISLRTRFSILKRDGFRCQYCGVHAGNAELCVDHVIPKSRGGKDEEWNFLTACTDCNTGKHDVDEDAHLLWALMCARDRDDHDTGFMYFIILQSRGWTPEQMHHYTVTCLGGQVPEQN